MFAFFSEGISFTTLLNLQNSFVWQVLPTMAVALHSDTIAAHPLLYGQVSGLATTLAMELVLDVDAGKQKADYILPSGLWAVMVNVCVVFLSQAILTAMGSSLASDNKRTTDTIRLKAGAEAGGPFWMKQPRSVEMDTSPPAHLPACLPECARVDTGSTRWRLSSSCADVRSMLITSPTFQG